MSVDTGRRPAGRPPPGGRRGPPSSRNPRSVRDRVSFKPIAILLLDPGDPGDLGPHGRRPRTSLRRRRSRRQRDPVPPRRPRLGLHTDPAVPRAIDDLRGRRVGPHPGVPGQPGDRPARRDLAAHPARGARHRGLGLLPARRDRRVVPDPGDHPERPRGRGGPGWIDHHAAAGRQRPRGAAVRRQRRRQAAGAGPGDPRGTALLEGADLRALPEPGLHGERRLRVRDGVPVLLPEARTRALAARRSHARGHDPGARILRPDRPPEEDAGSARRRPQADGGARLDQRGAPGPPQSEPAPAPRGCREAGPQAPSVLRDVPDRADHREPVGRVHGGARDDREGASPEAVRGRPRHPHHPRARLAVVGRGRGAEASAGLDLPAGRFATSRRLDRDDRQPIGRDEGDPLRPELPGGHARPRDHRTSARIGVQAVRPRRRLQGGHPTDADLLELLAMVLAANGTTRIIASRTPRAVGSVSSTCTRPPRTRSTSCSPSSSSMSERRWSRRSPSG